MISEEKLHEFYKTGVVVFENVFTEDEVNNIRKQFHDYLYSIGINHKEVLSGLEEPVDLPRIKGRASEIHYNKWKLDTTLDERVYNIQKELLVNTFGIKHENFDSPYEKFEDVKLFIDKVCYRLPDHIRPEGGLEMHLDRNPTDPYLLSSGGLKRWRPIQGFITLTDHYGSESGGLKVVKGFHKISDKYFEKSEIFEGGGEFCRLISKSHTKLEKKLEPINAPKGSIVMWDNRLPHSTSDKLISSDTREVIYVGYIPDIELNRQYCKEQLKNLRLNIFPPMYMRDKNKKCDKNFHESELTEFQKKLLCM